MVQQKKLDSLKKKPPAKQRKQQRQFRWVVGTLIGLVIIFFLFYWFFQSLSTFTYEELTFTKELYDDIPLYHYYYDFRGPEGAHYRYNLYIRNDPRRNRVPLTGEIVFTTAEPVYITIDSRELAYCPQSSVAVSTLASFLTNNFLTVKSGVPDWEMAQLLNRTYVTCETHRSGHVILLQAGNETKITNDGSCYTITAANCEVLPAVEKFIVQSIIDVRKRKGLA